MSVVYGTDYSKRELSPSELDNFHKYNIRFLIRYIGFPGNPKCISHYPGAYKKHVDAGRTVLLVHEIGTTDTRAGYAGGVAAAKRALGDARSIGYPEQLPIFFSADGWLADAHIPVATAMSYLDGAASVMTRPRTGAYGFRDFIKAAKAGGHARWLWLAGAAPTDAEVAQGWPHFYQYNNGHITFGDMTADLDWAYPGVLEALSHAPAAAAPHAHA